MYNRCTVLCRAVTLTLILIMCGPALPAKRRIPPWLSLHKGVQAYLFDVSDRSRPSIDVCSSIQALHRCIKFRHVSGCLPRTSGATVTVLGWQPDNLGLSHQQPIFEAVNIRGDSWSGYVEDVYITPIIPIGTLVVAHCGCAATAQSCEIEKIIHQTSPSTRPNVIVEGPHGRKLRFVTDLRLLNGIPLWQFQRV